MDVVAVADEGLGNRAYLVDLGDGGALVVDPERDPRPYRRELDRRRLMPRFVVETHLHADFVSGGRELVEIGAELMAPAGGGLAFEHRRLEDGQQVDLGGFVLEVIATPGHTPEHSAYVLLDGGSPMALFSGGTLMNGGVARPDLLSPESTEPLARAAYRSITQRLMGLPDDLPVYPTHGGGSFCSSVGGGEHTSTTIGRERAHNPLLADDPDEDTFVARLLGGLDSHPPYFLELRDVNRAGPGVIGLRRPPLPRLTVDQVDTATAAGAVVVDARSIEAFATGHVPGSVSIPWRAQFATWLGWLVRRDQPVVLVADGTVDRADLRWAANTVGYEHLIGELAGGMGAWKHSGRAVARMPLTGREGADGRLIVDIRQRDEFVAGHVPGALHVELGSLADRPDAIPAGPVLVHCGHGERAMSAASLLARAGHHDVVVLAGGPEDLGPLESGA